MLNVPSTCLNSNTDDDNNTDASDEDDYDDNSNITASTIDNPKQHPVQPTNVTALPMYTTAIEGSILSLPVEILEHIMMFSRTSPLELYSFAASHPILWAIYCNWRFTAQHITVLSKKTYLKGAEIDPRANAAKVLIKHLIEQAPDFVHEFNTCLNESINSSHTAYAPKSTYFCWTYAGRAWLSVARWNLGGCGALALALFRELGLPISSTLEAKCAAIDKAHQNAQIRQTSHEGKARYSELQKEHRKQRQEERKLSAAKQDEYRMGKQKTAFDILPEPCKTSSASPVTVLPSVHRHHRQLHLALDPTTLSADNVKTVKGKALVAALKYFNLPVKYTGEKADDQRERLHTHLMTHIATAPTLPSVPSLAPPLPSSETPPPPPLSLALPPSAAAEATVGVPTAHSLAGVSRKRKHRDSPLAPSASSAKPAMWKRPHNASPSDIVSAEAAASLLSLSDIH